MKACKRIFPLIAVIYLLTLTFPASSQPAFFCGFMIDAPRTTESLKYYFDIIDLCKANDLNTIIFRLTDDEGSAYRFSSRPDLIMCPGAYSQKEIKAIIAYAQRKGIEIIPEIEAFGHAKYITGSPRYKDLNDAAGEQGFNAVCPVNDSTFALMKDLFKEAAALFPSKYLHIGCDETSWGAGELSKKALQTKTRNQIWAEYVNKLDEYIKQSGRETIIWGDFPLYNENEVLDLLNKDIIIADWNYWENNPATVAVVAQKVLDKGFRVMGCPAISWCKWGARIGEAQFKNISAYTQVYAGLKASGNLGYILTSWVPQKYLQYSQWDSFIMAAAIARHQGRYNYMDAVPAFVKNTFGIAYDPGWNEIYKTLYTHAPQFSCADADSLKFFPWASQSLVKSLIMGNKIIENPFGNIKKLLSDYKKKIRKNKEVFEDLFITVDFLDYLFRRENDLLLFVRSGNNNPEAVGNYFKTVAHTDSVYRVKIKAAWLRGRRAMMNEYDKDFMYSFAKAADFSRQMAEQPILFLQICEKKQP